MANDNQAVGRALLQAVAGQYPAHSDSLLTTEVDAAVLPDILKEINADREQVFAELRQTSRDVAPDVDGWIKQATKLQADIERSKITAREIVRQAEEASELRRKHEDVNRKANLLKAELAFNGRLETALSSIQDIFKQIDTAQKSLQQGQLKYSLEQLKSMESSLVELSPIENTSAVDILSRRITQLREGLVDQVKSQWIACLHADRASRRFTIQQKPDHASLEELETLSSQLDILPGNIRQTCRDLEDVVFRPRLESGRQGRFYALSIEQDHIASLEGKTERDAPLVIKDILDVVKFLHARLPPCIAVELSESLMPPVISRLISLWMLPAVPTDLEELQKFQDLLDLTQNLSEELHNIGWSGSVDLKDWVEQGPRIWLSRRKESALDAVRHTLATQVTHTKTVERVETQVVAKDDAIHGPNGAGDEWDAWMEDEEEKPPLPDRPEDKSALPARSSGGPIGQADEPDAEDYSAWGADDPAEDAVQEEDGGASTINGDDEEGDAWGWDEPANSVPPTPAKSAKASLAQSNGTSHSNNKEREMTLKETYTVTTIPTSLHDLIEQLIVDASHLLNPSSPVHLSSVAAAAAGIYTIPVLLLACYRALAPTYYSPLMSGLMYLYNDSLYLSTLLQDSHDRLIAEENSPNNAFAPGLSQSSLPSSRLGLLEAVANLKSFGARSYGSEMDSQRTILRDMLDGAQGFSSCTEEPFRDACETAISMAVDRVRQVASMWQPVLSRSAWLQSLGSLISTITGKMCVEVEELSDISEEESNQLRKLCEQVNKLSDLFEQDSEGQNASEGQKVSLIHIYSPGWFKFQYLSEVLESSLADIKYLWNEGELKLEFEPDEIIMLIEALFAETDHRRRAIAEIRRG